MRSWGAVCHAAALVFGASLVDAADAPNPVAIPAQETWSGVEVTPHSGAIYAGYLYALGGDVTAEGLRFRLGSGYWAYRDKSTRWIGGAVVPVTLKGTSTFADVMIGYQVRYEALTMKLYAGAVLESQQWKPDDVNADLQGSWAGAKVALETWLNLSPNAFAQLDTSWSSAHDAFNARLRLGYAVIPALSIGPEVGYGGDRYARGARYGLFARYAWSKGEASLSGGLLDEGDGAHVAYGSANLLFRF